jgi:hypothetical protein
MFGAAVLLTIIGAGPAVAQDSTRSRWLDVHNQAIRPNYTAEILPDDFASIRLPAPPPGEPPAAVRALYMNAWIFSSDRFFDLLALADTTEINAFVIDVKDVRGFITYRSSIPIAVEIGANRLVRSRNVQERLAILEEHGIHPIARIVVAKDTMLANHKPEWAVRDVDGGLWHDRFGDPWVDAYCDSVWIYASDIAAEAVLQGFREIQFDYVRFPDEPAENLARAIFSARRPGESRRDGIRRNLQLAAQRVRALGVPFTADVFGLATSARNDLGIGQYWEDVLATTDAVLPMIYPSHYNAGAYGIPWPNSEPYEVVRHALVDGIARAAEVEGAARIRPFLQSFSIRRVVYTAIEVRAQIDAVEDLGLTDWVFWNASGRYPAAAFRPSQPPTIHTPDGGNPHN